MYPVDISGTVVGESPDCLLLSETVVGENPDHVCWVVLPYFLRPLHNANNHGPIMSLLFMLCLGDILHLRFE